MKRIVFIITILIITVAPACVSCPPVAARSYVPVPEKPARSASFAIDNGLDDAEAAALLEWIIKDGQPDDEVAGTRAEIIKLKLSPVLEELKIPATFKDLSKDGRINKFFRGLSEGRPMQALDARFQYRIKSNEILVLVDAISDHPADQYAFVFYRLPEDRSALAARAAADEGAVLETTIFSQLMIVTRNSVESVR